MSLIDVLNLVLAVFAAIGAFVGFVVSRRDRKADQVENERRLQANERRLQALEKIAVNSHVPRCALWAFERKNQTRWCLTNVGNGEAWEVKLSHEGGLPVRLPNPRNPWPPGWKEDSISIAPGQSGQMVLTVYWTDEPGGERQKQVLA